MRRLSVAVLGTVLLVGATACGDDKGSAGGNGSAAKDPRACAADATLTKGKLVIGTGNPAFPPYVLDDKPESGEGFEAAVAYAVADKMGFAKDAVSWTRTDFAPTIAPGPKEFDFNLQQFTITDERRAAVDLSDGYYTAAQAVFGYNDSAAASATSVADLAGLKIGVAASTTSVDYVNNVIKPKSEPLIFNDNAAAKAALDSKAIDAIVSDLPTALFITAVEIEGTKVFGQIEGSGTDQFGLVLAKGSGLTPCVNGALAALKKSGELDKITTKWMSEWSEAPVIKG